jgi:hypothetical protein
MNLFEGDKARGWPKGDGASRASQKPSGPLREHKKIFAPIAEVILRIKQ